MMAATPNVWAGWRGRFMGALLAVVTLSSVGFSPSAWAQAEHVLGAGDVVRIAVFQSPDLSLESRVSETGQITFPLVGSVMIGGLTPTQAEQRIARALRDGGFVNSPQVSVMLLQIRSSQMSILGMVGNPGRYPIESVNSRVSHMIAVAGGVVGEGADTVTLVGTRDGKPVRYEIDLPQIFQSGRMDQDITVMAGDIIYVQRAPTFYIYGEVQRPGMFRIDRGMTLLQALALGGGITLRGTERGIRVHRRDSSTGEIRPMQLNMDDLIQTGDVVYIRESLF